MAVEQCNIEGTVLIVDQINYTALKKPFQDSVLRERNVGITILDIFEEEIHDTMSHKQWPLEECCFIGS